MTTNFKPIFIRKPVEVFDARQVADRNFAAIVEWATDGGNPGACPIRIGSARLAVKTPIGEALAAPGDWIVRDQDGRYQVYGAAEFAANFQSK